MFHLIFRYYCGKPCQVSDWPRHKAYHKSLEESKHEQGSHNDMRQALGSLVIHDDGVSTVNGGSCPISREERDINGMTALLRAAYKMDWREVRKLIRGGADLNAKDDQGLTALHYAASFGSVELTRTLIEHGAAELAFHETPEGENSLAVACERGHVEIVKLLIDAGGMALVFKTARGVGEGDDEVQLDGCTCLHIACQYGHLAVVKTLIQAGGEALLRKTRSDGTSCLHIACHQGHLAIVKTLVMAGGEALVLMTGCSRDFSCLHMACFLGRVPVVDFLLSLPCAGQLLALRDRSGRTPLEFAIAAGQAAAAASIGAALLRPALGGGAPGSNPGRGRGHGSASSPKSSVGTGSRRPG
jgi:ankyrin repeat protein